MGFTARALVSITPVLTAALLATAACDKSAPTGNGGEAKPADEGEPAAAKEPPAEVAETVVTQEVKGGQLAKSSYKPATKEEAAVAKASFEQHLAAGRSAVKAKDYATGIAELHKAKQISPTNSSVLGELGWAYFQNGELEKAERELELSLTHVTKAGTKGAVLYNLGRVEEARGNKQLAADLYRQSVAVRPNDVVQKRLDGLGLGDEVHHAECTFGTPNSVPTDLCQAVADRANADASDADWVCEYNPTQETKHGDDEQVAVAAGESAYSTVFALSTDAYQATVFSLWDREFNMIEQFYVAVVIGDEYWVDTLQMVEHPGVGYADSNMNEVKVTAKDINGKGPPEIVISWSTGWHDMDPGIEYMEDGSSRLEAVITVDDGKPAWLGTFSLETKRESGDMDPNEWGAILDAATSGYRYGLSYDGKGGVTVTHEDGDQDEGMKVGSYPITEASIRCPSEVAYY